MFDELKSTIRHDVTHTIFRVTIQAQPAHRHPVARNVTEGRAPVAGTTSAAGAATATAVAGGGGNGSSPARSGPKIGRNEPCWCGSGKKYKKCHGA
jgi:preprotein translocase subunit SecA